MAMTLKGLVGRFEGDTRLWLLSEFSHFFSFLVFFSFLCVCFFGGLVVQHRDAKGVG